MKYLIFFLIKHESGIALNSLFVIYEEIVFTPYRAAKINNNNEWQLS